MVEGNKLPLIVRTTDLYGEKENGVLALPRAIQTYYEAMWMSRGISIKYQCFRLPHDGVLTEPEIESELDEYRSYHRDKRSSKQTAK